ncbi:JAB domain-containing protein [Halolactibacillus sp. JCM 19043]|uniref:JAB domain-containing protein n=1 Tax=Halolactibacillus sp. JCM 19043 TaxID=1460638 RepID=UPI0021016785|nr:JAB domain-containing protein [Halolactibacillus sp. JCM 19043]
MLFHPSGNVSPSAEDISVTERLVKAGEYIGINVLDHIIVSQNASLSLKERGYV